MIVKSLTLLSLMMAFHGHAQETKRLEAFQFLNGAIWSLGADGTVTIEDRFRDEVKISQTGSQGYYSLSKFNAKYALQMQKDEQTGDKIYTELMSDYPTALMYVISKDGTIKSRTSCFSESQSCLHITPQLCDKLLATGKLHQAKAVKLRECSNLMNSIAENMQSEGQFKHLTTLFNTQRTKMIEADPSFAEFAPPTKEWTYREPKTMNDAYRLLSEMAGAMEICQIAEADLPLLKNKQKPEAQKR